MIEMQYRLGEDPYNPGSFHVREFGRFEALCGAPVLPSGMGLEAWGYVGSMKEKYCADCEKMSGIKNAYAPSSTQEPSDDFSTRQMLLRESLLVSEVDTED